MKTSTILLKTRNLIEKRGWIQYAYYNSGGYCILGALDKIIIDHPGSSYSEVTDILNAFVFSVQNWNDVAARNKQEVLDLLDCAASAALSDDK